MHGTSKARGCSHLRLGNFTKMFPNLNTWAKDAGVTSQDEAEKLMSVIGAPNGIMYDVKNISPNNPNFPAAYTFFGQFIDHDITLDVTTDLHGETHTNQEIDNLPNLRSASLDLDSIYGFGPEASSFLYDPAEMGKLLIGNNENPNDVPRNDTGRALIGDPRNDENIFISQMQLLFLRFHNLMLVGRTFEEAQTEVKYHYQWLVLYDFLKRLCDKEIFNYVIKAIEKGKYPKIKMLDDCKRVRMPVEFSVAAFRFGHSAVRSQYPVNLNHPAVELFDEMFGTLGFSTVPLELVVDWRYLLPVDKRIKHALSKAIDHLLPSEFMQLPIQIVGLTPMEIERSLAFRNLLRGYVLGLPSGQAVAIAFDNLGYPLDSNQDLKFSMIDKWSKLDTKIQNIISNHTPLFLYVLREAGTIGGGERLGPVGSAILLETFGNILLNCDTFLTSNKKKWAPDTAISGEKDFTLSVLVDYVNRNTQPNLSPRRIL